MKEETEKLGEIIADLAVKDDKAGINAIKNICPELRRVDIFAHAMKICAVKNKQNGLNLIAYSFPPNSKEVLLIHSKVSSNLALIKERKFLVMALRAYPNNREAKIKILVRATASLIFQSKKEAVKNVLIVARDFGIDPKMIVKIARKAMEITNEKVDSSHKRNDSLIVDCVSKNFIRC